MHTHTHRHDLTVKSHSVRRKSKHGNLLWNCPANTEGAVKQLVEKDYLGSQKVSWPLVEEPRGGRGEI